LENIDFIVNIFKNRIEKNNREMWLKSYGEFYAFIVLIIIFNNNIFINQSNVDNPLTNKKLEIDFFINDTMLAIEIDGKQHGTNENTKINDKIKDVLLKEQDITLIRIEWNNNNKETFMLKLYNDIVNFLKKSDDTKQPNDKRFNIQNIISEDNFKKLIILICSNIKLGSMEIYFNYNTKYYQDYNLINNGKIQQFDNHILNNVVRLSLIEKEQHIYDSLYNKYVEEENTKQVNKKLNDDIMGEEINPKKKTKVKSK
jgi:very-short-patch-repair endonuclease